MLTHRIATRKSPMTMGIGAWATHFMKTYPLTVIDIECAAAFDVSVADMHSRNRTQPVADARQAAMWFADLDDNYPHLIARFYGQTLCNVKLSIRAAANKLATDKIFAARMNLIGERLMRQTCTPPANLVRRHD